MIRKNSRACLDEALGGWPAEEPQAQASENTVHQGFGEMYFSVTSHVAEGKQAHTARITQAVSTKDLPLLSGVISHTAADKGNIIGIVPVWAI